MKNLLYILPFLLLPFMVVAQEQTVNDPVKKDNTNFKNQIDLDVEFILAFEFLYKRKIGKKIFIGGGFGFGVNALFSEKGSAAELLKVKLALEVQFYRKLYVVQELGYSLIYGLESGFTYRIGTSIYYGWDKIRIGFKPAIMIPVNQDDLPSFKDSFLAIPLISLKIPLKRW